MLNCANCTKSRPTWLPLSKNSNISVSCIPRQLFLIALSLHKASPLSRARQKSSPVSASALQHLTTYHIQHQRNHHYHPNPRYPLLTLSTLSSEHSSLSSALLACPSDRREATLTSRSKMVIFFLREMSREWVTFWDSEFIRNLVTFERNESKSKFVIFYVSFVFWNILFIFLGPTQCSPTRWKLLLSMLPGSDTANNTSI